MDARDMIDSLLSGSMQDGEALVNKHDAVEIMKQSKRKHDNISYGFPTMDRKTGGIRRGRMTIIASRPGVGKSDISLHIARENLQLGRNVLIASIEMDREEVIARLSIPVGQGFMYTEEEEYERKINGAEYLRDKVKGNYYVFDQENMTTSDVLALVTDEIDVVILDYMQIMNSESWHKSEYEKVSDLSNSLRAAAKTTKAAWIVLSQLSRPHDKKNAERQEPSLTDLRGSGSLEQDAYAVMLMNVDGDIEDGKQPIMLSVAKNRGGGTGKSRASVNRLEHTWWEV